MNPSEGKGPEKTGQGKKISSLRSAPAASGRPFSFPGSLLFFLAAAVLFHILLFLLFRPMTKVHNAKSPGKGFILLLSEEKKKEAVREYGLEYFLAYSDPARAKEVEKRYGFGTWERFADLSPFSPQIMGKYAEKALLPVREEKKREALPAPRTLAELSETNPMNIPLHEATPPRAGEPVTLNASNFPFWHFSTGKKFRGLPANAPGSGETLQKYGKKASASTCYRIAFAGKNLPPDLTLLRSCGSEELDRLARQELYMLLGAPFREEKKSPPRVFFCTVVWSEALLVPEKTGKKDVLPQKTRESKS